MKLCGTLMNFVMTLLLVAFLQVNYQGIAWGEGEKSPSPDWIKAPMADKKYVYVVGEAKDIDNKEDALERAWISALLRIGMTQFPELGMLHTQSSETLHDADYKRQFAVRLEKLNWQGIKEMDDLHSPYVVFNEDKKSYSVYRLLRWSREDIEAARKKVQKGIVYALPARPEVLQGAEDDVISEVMQLQQLNRKIEDRDAFVGRIIRNIKCGVSVKDLIRILGPADRESPNNDNMYYYTLEYTWGTYLVKQSRKDNFIYTVTTKNGGGDTRYVCSNY